MSRHAARLIGGMAAATFLAIVPVAPGFEPAPGGTHTTPSTLEELKPDIEAYRQHVMTLSNPFFEGRAPGTYGNRRAADYIEFHFRSLGLTPAFPETSRAPDGTVISTPFATFRQVFKAPDSARPGDMVRLTDQQASYSIAGGGRRSFEPGRDFSTLGYSGSGQAEGELVFVGYGVESAREGEYTSFPDNLDLAGKIALVLRFEPMNDAGRSLWAEQGWSPQASLDAKLRALARRNAAGVILVNTPGAADERAGRLEGLELAGRRPLQVPVVMARPEAVERLIADATGGSQSLMSLRRAADAGTRVESFENVRVSLSVALDRIDLMTDNVGAVLRGRGPLAEQYVVIGAHYDHVGYGYLGAQPQNRGKLHPGADDNASGTSGVLMAARRLSEAYESLPPEASARSVLFLAFSSEEAGLIGSQHYCANPITAPENHYLMLNMDMVGRMSDKPTFVENAGTGEGLRDWAGPYIERSGLNLVFKDDTIGRSDHVSFTRIKVPNLFFFTGFHGEYHTPADVASLINVEGAAQLCDLVCRLSLDAAQRTEPLPFKGRQNRRTPRPAPEEPAPPAVPPAATPAQADSGDEPPVGRTSASVRFGGRPASYDEGTGGIEIAEVGEDTPAQAAGVKPGDVMVKWDGVAIADVGEWMPLLRRAKPGDALDIVVQREGKEITLRVVFPREAEPASPR